MSRSGYMTASPQQGCYFFHIPKTAGMSTWQLLEWAYPPERICPGRMWEDIINIGVQHLAKYDVFRGHFLAYLEPFLGRKLPTFTVLRNPVERTISHYCHVRRSPEHPYYPVAQTLSLQEFCTDARTRHMVQNYQSGYLACRCVKDPRLIARGMTQADLAVYKLQLALDPSPDEFPSESDLYQAAMRRLESFFEVGTSETLHESMLAIAGGLGIQAPPHFERRNVGSNRPETIDDSTLRTIWASTQVDHALYDLVQRRALVRAR